MADLTDEQLKGLLQTGVLSSPEARALVAEVCRRRAEERGEIASVPAFYAEFTNLRTLVAECLAEHDAAKGLFHREDQPDAPVTARIRAALVGYSGEGRAAANARGRELATRLDPKDVRDAFDKVITRMHVQAQCWADEGLPAGYAALKATASTAVLIRDQLLGRQGNGDHA